MHYLKGLIGILIIGLIAACNPPQEKFNDRQEYEKVSSVDTSEGLFAIITCTRGQMIAKLFPDKAPMTVANFVGLAEGSMPNTFRSEGEPFYDSLKFHRVISLTTGEKENFMAQGGDPLGNGTGGPGYRFKDEFSDLRMDGPGWLAMANSGPSTNGSQFFITIAATQWLNDKHTIFGKLITGTEVPFLLKNNDYIIKIKILRKGAKAVAYKALDEFYKQGKKLPDLPHP